MRYLFGFALLLSLHHLSSFQNGVEQVQQAQYVWDFGSAYRTCAQLSKRFHKYNWVFHNCRDFSRDFYAALQANGTTEQEATTGDWPIDKLLALARQEKVPFQLTDDDYITKMFRHSGFWVLRRVLDKGVSLT